MNLGAVYMDVWFLCCHIKNKSLFRYNCIKKKTYEAKLSGAWKKDRNQVRIRVMIFIKNVFRYALKNMANQRSAQAIEGVLLLKWMKKRNLPEF